MSASRHLFEISVDPEDHLINAGERSGQVDASEEIALPNEIPPPPQLGGLPVSILHAATVETLLGQNEDLHARLAVSIRLNAQLERQIIDLEESLGEQRQSGSSLLAQAQVLEEKDKAWRGRLAEVEKSLEKNREALEEQTTLNQRLNQQLAERNLAFESLKNRLIEASSHVEAQERAVEGLQTQISADFEERLQSVLTEYQKLQTELVPLRERAARLDQVSEKQIETENRAIYFERRSQELEAKFAAELAEANSQSSTYRNEAKNLAVQLNHASESLKSRQEETAQFQASFAQLQDQFESLQAIWNESQKQLEEVRLKNDSLQKINLELSRKLKDQRRSEVASSASGGQSSETNGLSQSEQTQKFAKLESLLVGIQAGFPQTIIEKQPTAPESQNDSFV